MYSKKKKTMSKALSVRKRIKKSVNEYKRLKYNLEIMKKLNSIQKVELYYGVREINDLDQNQGKVELSDRTVAVSGVNRLPLCVLPLRNIINGGDTGSGLLYLQQNGHDFVSGANVEYMGAKGNIDTDPPSTVEFSKLLHNYTEIKMLIWQNQDKDVKFNVYLLKIYDEDMNPNNLTTTSSDAQNKRTQLFYYHMLRHQLTNPILENTETHLKDIKGKFKILWKKEYHIQERSADHSQNFYKQINFFRRYNDIVRYDESPTTIGNPPESPDNVNYTSIARDPTAVPFVRDNLFLIITANTTKSDVDSAVSYDTATFDINVRSKYTAPSANVY